MPCGRFVDLEDLADVRVADARGGARLPPEPRSGGLVGQAGNHLQRDLAAQAFIACHVDNAHAAAAQRPHDHVASDGIAWIQIVCAGRAHAAVHCDRLHRERQVA
jgi:hypothetical protein